MQACNSNCAIRTVTNRRPKQHLLLYTLRAQFACDAIGNKIRAAGCTFYAD